MCTNMPGSRAKSALPGSKNYLERTLHWVRIRSDRGVLGLSCPVLFHVQKHGTGSARSSRGTSAHKISANFITFFTHLHKVIFIFS
jgi:hypothetical protein